MMGEPEAQHEAALSVPPEPDLTVHFGLDSLYELRSSVAAHASALGLDGDRLSHLLVVATELATNAVRHGGGSGTLRLWSAGGAIYCQVSDGGSGIADPHTAGTMPTPITREGSRGLWMARQLSDDMRIANNHPGSAVTVRFDLP